MRSEIALLRALLVAANILVLVESAQAEITVFNSQSSYLAAIASPGVDTFAGLSVVAVTPGPINRTAGPYGYVASATTTQFFGAGTADDPWLCTNVAGDTITLGSFTGGVVAVGGQFFGSGSAGQFTAGTINVEALDSLGASVSVTIPDAPLSNFIGFVSDAAMTSVRVYTTQPLAGFVWPTVDNLTLGVAPPFVQKVFDDGFESP